jgi:tetratricopeptide (TPR) repeat protein
LGRVAGSPEESEIYLPALLEMAYAMRFAPETAAKEQAGLRSPGELGLAARGALSFDMPAAQAALGAQLARLPSAPPALHGSGEISQGVALMALGQPSRALPHFDAAVRLLADRGEARLQAAEWRVLPSALGLPGIPPAELERGRRDLALLANDSALGPRAAWALAFEALRRGETSLARPWILRVGSRADSTDPLALQLHAMELSLAGQFERALDLSQPALAYDSAGKAGDPFFRAALHLQRGEWHARTGQKQAADAAWLWYENLDAVGWPSAVAQACEVDWALGTYARWHRARLASAGVVACRHMADVIQLWADAEPAYQPLLSDARAFIRQCPR